MFNQLPNDCFELILKQLDVKSVLDCSRTCKSVQTKIKQVIDVQAKPLTNSIITIKPELITNKLFKLVWIDTTIMTLKSLKTILNDITQQNKAYLKIYIRGGGTKQYETLINFINKLHPNKQLFDNIGCVSIYKTELLTTINPFCKVYRLELDSCDHIADISALTNIHTLTLENCDNKQHLKIFKTIPRVYISSWYGYKGEYITNINTTHTFDNDTVKHITDHQAKKLTPQVLKLTGIINISL